MLAAAFAFSAPATAQDAPGDAPADVSTAPTDTPTGGSDTPEAGASEGETEPAETPEAGTEEPETPPPGSETPPADTTEPAEGTPPAEGTDPAEPAPPAEECTAGAEGCEPADEPTCEAGTTAAPVAMTGSPGAGCEDVVELEPGPTPPPPAPPSAPTPPAPPAPQAAAPAPTGNSIVLLIAEAGPGPSQLPELANGLAPDGGRISTLISTVVLGGPDETGTPEAADEDRGATDHALALAHWAESMASSQREGPCAPLSSAGMAPLSDTCPSSQRQSILTIGTQPLPDADRAIILPAPPPPDTRLPRHRRTHPEAQSDTERPAVAAAPATSTRDHGRRLAGGGAPGGSSAAAGLRIFAVSTSPLLLTAPVTFPTEPQPSVLPEGEPGVPPPASPG